VPRSKERLNVTRRAWRRSLPARTLTMAHEVLIALPLYDGRVHQQTMGGILQTLGKYGPERVSVIARQGSFLPRLRDLLTIDFVQSGAKYMLCLDSDIGWGLKDLEMLLSASKELVTDREFVAGAYAKKNVADRSPIVSYNGDEQGALKGAHFVGAGFMLLPRAGVLRMIETYKDLAYPGDAVDPKNGVAFGLWNPLCSTRDTEGKPRYLGEDYSFDERWRQMGGKIWVHTGTKLRHIGEASFTLSENA
jgi:hypothetical protein